MTDGNTALDYTAEDLANAKKLVEHDNAKKAAELAGRRAAYLAAVTAVTATPEWAKVRDGLSQIVATLEADGLLSSQVTPLSEIMARLDKMVPAFQPAA